MKATKKIKKNKLTNFGFVEKDVHYWWASWYAEALDYSSISSLKSVIKKAMKTSDFLSVPREDNFYKTTVDRKTDYKLTKFACLLIALHADQRKKQVKKAKVFFMNEMQHMNINLYEDNLIERFMANETLIRMHKQLSKVATRAKVKNYQSFNNEGYKGLYNQTTSDLRIYRGYSATDDLSDRMSLTELLANMMRVNLTISALKFKNVESEKYAAKLHRRIGKEVRMLIKTCTSYYPEQLPRKMDLEETKRRLAKKIKGYNKYHQPRIET